VRVRDTAPVRQRTRNTRARDPFDRVSAIGRALPGVEAATRYDGSPVLRIDGVFMAGLATHSSVEPGTLVVRSTFDDRERLLEDAPGTYYVTEYYVNLPVVLVRLAHIDEDALRDLLTVSRRLTLPKVRTHRRPNAARRSHHPIEN
jgi:hypothetical protein